MSFTKALFASILGVFISISLVIFVMIMITFGIISSATSGTEVAVAPGSVLKIKPDGGIAEYVGSQSLRDIASGSSRLTLRGYLNRIQAAAKDDRIKGIWLQLGSYSGSWAQASELREKLVAFRKSGKFIYAVSDVNGWNEVNYFLASAADSVIMSPAAHMELNGIYAALPFFKPLLDKLGVKAEIVRAGSFKSAVEPFILDSASAESRLMVSQMVESSFGVFLRGVQESRKVSAAELQDIVQNRAFLSAAEAQAAQLVDAVMFNDQVLDLLRKRTGKGEKDEPSVIKLEDYEVDAESGDRDGAIALVYAVGAIGSGESRYNPNPLFGGEMLGSETFVKALRTAREDDGIKAIVIRIDSPGGDAAASEEMWREIVLTREVKPVIVSMAGVAASGGYYIAAPADTIIAESATITGSIGVFGMWFNMKELMEKKVGINTQVIKNGPYADMYSSARPALSQELMLASRQVDSVYHTFLTVVSQGRGLSMDSVHAIAQGRVWTGEQAQALGLVDLLGGLDRALEVAAVRGGLKEGRYSVRVLPKKKDFFETLSETFGSGVAAIISGRTSIDDYKVIYEAMQERSGVQARLPDIVIR